MRVEHIPVRRNTAVSLPKQLLEQLPGTVCLLANSQFLNQLDQIKAQIEAQGKQVILSKARHTAVAGQVLGCSTETIDAPAFLFIGEGLFHPQALAYANNAPVYTFDPLSGQAGMINRKEIEARKKKREAGIKTFYHSNKIGVLVSTKSGQKDMMALQKLKEEYPEKEFYAFLGNTIDLQSLENFPFVQVWLNTACPRIGYDDIDKTTKPLINAEDVLKTHRF